MAKSTKAQPKIENPAEPPSPVNVDDREKRIFRAIDQRNSGTITPVDLRRALLENGILRTDSRISAVENGLNGLNESESMTLEQFCQIVRPNIGVVEKAIQGRMVVPDFQSFSQKVRDIYVDTIPNQAGHVADYIPQLGRIAPEQYGVSVCTVDGQRCAFGEHDVDFCVQSTSKPITYCLALEEHGAEAVHQYIGREPSGRGFNELTLNHDGRPHNPMINSGAIMSCSMIRPDLDIADRFDYVIDRWRALCGDQKVSFSNSVYLSERQTADRNFALGYFMQENKAFPDWADMIQTLEFYFQCCSIELNADKMSIMAGTLANGGICPVTGERVFSSRTVQNCLSLMYSCGMYDFSGEFAFTIGLPAKSGVSGTLMIVVPNVMGICTWSPRLDRMGNSVRGIDFCREFVQKFNFHNYDNLSGLSEKQDPRNLPVKQVSDTVGSMIWAASKGDLSTIVQLEAQGADIAKADYDGRTPLHLAASEGQLHVVDYFANRGVELSPKDRWGGTPLSDAQREGHAQVTKLLKTSGAL